MAKSQDSPFRTSALASGLVTREQLTQAEQLVTAANKEGAGVSDDQLAARLVDMRVLTAYQADQLQAGRIKLTLGPYLVTDFIGQGGMGHVFKAVHQVMGRVTAVKVLPQHKSTPESIANFQREIRMQARLDHPNLVRAYDAGHDGNVHYLVTEYVPGMDLRRLVRSQGPLTMQQASGIIMQAARGLHYAHQRNLIHRDVKPGNILVTPRGEAKVSDLGLAGCVDESEDDPQQGKIVGTADYLSPEQIKSPDDITAASDIYSLGCTLYYAVTGKVPFPGGTTRDKSRRHLYDTPWHPRRFNPDVSEEFVEIIADMMEKEPERRIQRAADAAARLESWIDADIAFPSQQLIRSPWLPPPLPGDEEFQDTDDGGYEDIESLRQESTSQTLQGTDRFGSGSQDTRSVSLSRRSLAPPPIAPAVPPLPPRILSRGVAVAIALAVAIPSSMLLGAALSVALIKLLGIELDRWPF